MIEKIPIIIFTTPDGIEYGKKACEETWIKNITDEYEVLWNEVQSDEDNPIQSPYDFVSAMEHIFQKYTFPYCLVITE